MQITVVPAGGGACGEIDREREGERGHCSALCVCVRHDDRMNSRRT